MFHIKVLFSSEVFRPKAQLHARTLHSRSFKWVSEADAGSNVNGVSQQVRESANMSRPTHSRSGPT